MFTISYAFKKLYFNYIPIWLKNNTILEIAMASQGRISKWSIKSQH